MNVLRNFSLVNLRNCRAFSRNRIVITDEVKTALTESKPVVALESTIVTHGMPFPSNVECALEVENVVRSQGAIPATIAILNGMVKVGLTKRELELLGDVTCSKPIKTSRRDFGYVLSRRLNGGTTVAGTVAICKTVGITVFATGGIGGVHRSANETFDVSADLTELGRCNVAVVASGVKSILDIPKTLEFLETQGVHVCTIASTKSFPAFYCSTSSYEAPYNVETPLEAAKIIQAHLDLGLESGLLFAVPVPEQYSLESQFINRVIDEALAKAHEAQIRGKAITPFLLSEIAKMASGNSLETNIALIKNNAKVAAEISLHLTEMKNSYTENLPELFASQGISGTKHPVIIGGSNLDCVVRLDVDEIKLDGRIHVGRFDYSPGGVGRNICEALGKLGFPAYFVSAIGDDYQGEILLKQIPNLSKQSVAKVAGHNTAQCVVVLDSTGECSFLIGDMKIHEEISPKMVEKHESLIKAAPLVVMDGNLSIEAMDKLLGITEQHNIPVVYEPTDIATACKPFTTTKWKSIKYITPNLAELEAISRFLNCSTPSTFSPGNQIEYAAFLAQLLARDISNVLVTMGPKGILIAHKENEKNISLRHYPAQKLDNIVNVSGAGDCLASGYIAAVLSNSKESVCVSVGFAAALKALQSHSPVPKNFFDKTHPAWRTEASYVNLQLRDDKYFFNGV